MRKNGLANSDMLKYYGVHNYEGYMGKMNILHNTTLIAILAIAAIGITSGTVIATQTISEDLVIEAGNGDPGNLIIDDGRFGIGATPGTNQLIFANGKDGIPASFRVDGVNSAAVFSMRATGGQPVFQWIDDDVSPSTKFQARIAQPDTGEFQIIDATTLPAKVKISIDKDGNMCLGDC